MNLIVRHTATLSGQATPPSSKSQNIRGLIFALMARGTSTLGNILNSEDTEDALRACEALGAVVNRQNQEISITSAGLPLTHSAAVINTGNSGITTRFILPLLGFRQNPQPIFFDCGEQMRKRPIHTLVEALRNLGMKIDYLKQEGNCPLSVSGHLLGGKTAVDGLSSQYLSALLIALPCAEQDSEVRVQNLHERPYVEMTLQWLQEQGIDYKHRTDAGMDIFSIPGQQRYRPFHKLLTGDFSSASSLIVAGALLGHDVEINGLDMHDTQGDKHLIDILKNMGAAITVEGSRLMIRATKSLTGLHIDANDIPDLLPVLAVVGTQAAGKTILSNVRQARIKETDRIHSLTEGLRRMGATVEEQADGMTIYPSPLTGASVRGFGDHRTVMALAVAGLTAQGVTLIDDAEAINKTFPTFIEMMRGLGANLELS